MVGPEFEDEQLVRDEQEARLRYEAAREQNLMDEGEAPREHGPLVQKLEAEWKAAFERLNRARKSSDG